MKTKLLFLLVFAASFLVSAQTLKLVSANTGEPLSNVSFFSAKGELYTTSDVEGLVQRDALLPVQESYILVHDSYTLATVSAKDLQVSTLKLNDRVTEIAPVVVSSKKARFMTVRGPFNVYLTVNKEFNVYADGIATYVYDSNTKKVKDLYIEQYRSFTRKNENEDRKKIASMVYTGFLKLPELERIGKMQEQKTNPKNKYKEVSNDDITMMQLNSAALQEKPFSIFGYSFYDFVYKSTVNFTKGSVNLRDFTGYNEQLAFKLKHKSEPDFHQMIKYATFIPQEIGFTDKPESNKVKLDPAKSSYSERYWEEVGFPNMQPVFSSFSGEGLHEGPNGGQHN